MQNGDLEERLQKLATTLDSSKRECTGLKDDLKNVVASKQSIEGALDATKKQLSDVQAQFMDERMQNASMAKALDDAKSSEGKLAQMQKDLNERYAACESALAGALKKNAQLQKELTAAQDERVAAADAHGHGKSIALLFPNGFSVAQINADTLRKEVHLLQEQLKQDEETRKGMLTKFTEVETQMRQENAALIAKLDQLAAAYSETEASMSASSEKAAHSFAAMEQL